MQSGDVRYSWWAHTVSLLQPLEGGWIAKFWQTHFLAMLSCTAGSRERRDRGACCQCVSVRCNKSKIAWNKHMFYCCRSNFTSSGLTLNGRRETDTKLAHRQQIEIVLLTNPVACITVPSVRTFQYSQTKTWPNRLAYRLIECDGGYMNPQHYQVQYKSKLRDRSLAVTNARIESDTSIWKARQYQMSQWYTTPSTRATRKPVAWLTLLRYE